VFRVGADGLLAPVQDLSDTAALALLTPTEIVALAVGGSISLWWPECRTTASACSGSVRTGGWIMWPPYSTRPRPACGRMGLTSAEIGGRSFLFASGLQDDGISVFEVGADGRLDHRGSLGDESDPHCT
jgi:hypothetical protein